MNDIKLLIKPKKITKLLIKIILFLVLISIIGQFLVYFVPDFPLRDALAEEFNVDVESNFPSLFSALLLFTSACLLWLICRTTDINRSYFTKYWRVLSLMFFYLSIDELLGLHERVIPFFRRLGFSGYLYHGWVVLAFVAIPLLGLFFFKFIFALPVIIRSLFISAAIIYILGAVGVETIGAQHVYLYGADNFLDKIITTVEEFLEMIGITIFIYSLLLYLQTIGFNCISLHLFIVPDRK
ncbi:MAG: hypothetical protein QNJ72_26605 [Pleurocapsa sp. MO_226.B13]|nr:hypothetical protein [Pleurocapsa sp. MO_226.B13]